MANTTIVEQTLVEVLDEWTRRQGVVLVQANANFFMQLLRERGYDIVKQQDLAKIRYEHKYLREQVLNIYRTAAASKVKLDQLNEKMELIGKDDTTESKPEPKKADGKKTPGQV